MAILALIGGWRLHNAVRDWRIRRRGRRGEKEVADVLRRLPRREATVVNDLLLPVRQDATSQIDHIVVSRRGIFIIETKSHKGRIVGSEHSHFWRQELWKESHSFYNPLIQNAGHIKTLRRLLPDAYHGLMVSVVVFTDADEVDIAADDIVTPRRLLPDRHRRRTFDPEREVRGHWWRRGRSVTLDPAQWVMRLPALYPQLRRLPKVIGPDEVEAITEALSEADLRRRADRRDHRRQAREAASHADDCIRQGICPRCGAPLERRRGDFGPFLGCTRFPECRFTCGVAR